MNSSLRDPPLTQPTYKVSWKTLIIPILGLTAFLAYIYIFGVDFQQILVKVQTIDLSFYSLAVCAVILDTFFFSAAWYFLLRFLKVKISLSRLSLFVWAGIFVDSVIPAESVSGEITKVYLVNREQNGTSGQATASIVAQRIISMTINIITLMTGALLLFVESSLYGMILNLILFIVCVTFLFLALILLMCVKENWTLALVEKVINLAERISRGRWKLTRLKAEVAEATKTFHTAMREYAHAPKTLIAATFFSVTSWILALVVFYLTFRSIGYTQLNWSAILVTSSIFTAVKSIPIGVPFEIGLPEITLSTLFILFGVPSELSFTATILMRLLTFWLRFLFGFAAQQWLGIKAITTKSNDAKNHDQSVKT